MKNYLQTVYLSVFEFFLFFLFSLRLVETWMVFKTSEEQNFVLFKNEIIGFFQDSWISFLIFLFIFPLTNFIKSYSQKTGNTILLLITLVLAFIHLICISFFCYQLIRLDVFIYKYELKEMWMTVNTTDSVNVNMYIFIFCLFCVIYTIGFRWFSRKQFSSKKLKLIIDKRWNWVSDTNLLSTDKVFSK